MTLGTYAWCCDHQIKVESKMRILGQQKSLVSRSGLDIGFLTSLRNDLTAIPNDLAKIIVSNRKSLRWNQGPSSNILVSVLIFIAEQRD
ncbi:hypothetical protein O9993_23430 [Vibrio lentus]|nr:hypothetical protein [Vibrio lentus]